MSGYHYNFHVQPYNGSTDYHNYHIAYIGTGGTDYRWQIKDSIKNTCRTYDESWNVYLSDATYYALAAFSVDVSNDTGSTELENAMNNQGSKAFQNAFAELYYV